MAALHRPKANKTSVPGSGTGETASASTPEPGYPLAGPALLVVCWARCRRTRRHRQRRQSRPVGNRRGRVENQRPARHGSCRRHSCCSSPRATSSVPVPSPASNSDRLPPSSATLPGMVNRPPSEIETSTLLSSVTGRGDGERVPAAHVDPVAAACELASVRPRCPRPRPACSRRRRAAAVAEVQRAHGLRTIQRDRQTLGRRRTQRGRLAHAVGHDAAGPRRGRRPASGHVCLVRRRTGHHGIQAVACVEHGPRRVGAEIDAPGAAELVQAVFIVVVCLVALLIRRVQELLEGAFKRLAAHLRDVFLPSRSDCTHTRRPPAILRTAWWSGA